MIVLFTDFGWRGPYIGQMKAVLARDAPDVVIVDLLHDAPVYDPRTAAYLLAAYLAELPSGAVLLGVVDPGVGSAARRPVIVELGKRWLVGPDNGLFAIAARRAGGGLWHEILWRPARLSATFHGRDLFAPVAARLAQGVWPETRRLDAPQSLRLDWPEDLAEVVYVDHYGNLITGMRAGKLGSDDRVAICGRALSSRRTFSDAAVGEVFWYENSSGLVEIAANQGSAAEALGARLGTQFDYGN